jgi:hypothetical protein
MTLVKPLSISKYVMGRYCMKCVGLENLPTLQCNGSKTAGDFTTPLCRLPAIAHTTDAHTYTPTTGREKEAGDGGRQAGGITRRAAANAAEPEQRSIIHPSVGRERERSTCSEANSSEDKRGTYMWRHTILLRRSDSLLVPSILPMFGRQDGGSKAWRLSDRSLPAVAR